MQEAAQRSARLCIALVLLLAGECLIHGDKKVPARASLAVPWLRGQLPDWTMHCLFFCQRFRQYTYP
jgi:hypothetical protein